MAGSDYSLNLAINGVNNASSAISGVISSLGPLGMAAGLATAALAGVGIVLATSVQKAANFQTQLTSLVTGAGESQKNIHGVGQGLLKMSIDTATGTDKLTAGMFTVESAGYRGADGLRVMQAAAQGAKVGNADLTGMTDVLTTSLHNYNLQSSQSVPVVNSFISTVANGKMVMDDLNASLTGVLPTASKAGVKLTDVEGALATMAASGDKGASAGTHLSQMFQSLQNPAAAATKVLKSIGLTTQGISNDMKKSLPDTIQVIYNALAKKFPVGSAAFNAAAAKIVGGNKQVKAWNEMTGTSFKDLGDNTRSIANAYKHSGSSVTDFSDVQKTFNFQMDQAKQAVNEAQIEIGQKLLPVLGKIMGALNPLITGFAKWVGTLHADSPAVAVLGGVLAALAVVVLVAVVPAMLAAAGGLLAVTIAGAPLWIILIAIIAVVTAIILVFQHWGQITDWLSGKMEQLRIKNEEAHVKMKIAADTNTAEQAKKVIANIDKERIGVLQKLRETHDPAERMELQHQLKMIDIQLQHQSKRLAAAEKDKAAQLAKQKQLHADMIEAQKNWFQRFLDMCGSWIGDQMSKLGTLVRGWVDWLGNLKDQATAKFEELVADLVGKALELKTDVIGHVLALRNDFIAHIEYLKTMVISKILEAKNNFLSQVQELKDQGIQKVSSFITGVENFFTSLPGKALQWGEDMLQGFINGITSKISDLTSTVSNVAGSVAKFLHFTKPDVGPLVTADEWMPHLGNTLIEGLDNVTPRLQAAAIRAAAAVARAISGTANGAMPMHVFDFIGSDYKGYAQGMATTAKRNLAEEKKKERETLALEKLQATLEKHIRALEEPSKTPKLKTAKERSAYDARIVREEAALRSEEAHIQKLEQQYHITVNHSGKGKWTKQDAQELAQLIADQARLQSKHPQTASGRRN